MFNKISQTLTEVKIEKKEGKENGLKQENIRLKAEL